ncbi:protein kinase domain-containing protein [Sorangium sp. So ce1389]|uniref:protein kinase domain-containing protein n=1 Tax=Sorangium sp. So ce1389 TaxID=3133336 RepID=UPI003F635BB5
MPGPDADLTPTSVTLSVGAEHDDAEPTLGETRSLGAETREVRSLVDGAAETRSLGAETREVRSLVDGAAETHPLGDEAGEARPRGDGAGEARASNRATREVAVAPRGEDDEAKGGGAAPGQVIARRYQLIGPLGAGSYGEVWTAQDLVLGRPVALKWMHGSAGASAARVRREIAALRMLRVPGVVQLLDEGVEGDRPFLVMERVEGTPFPGDAAPDAPPPSRRAWADIAAPALALFEVLARVHAAGIVHRDLKPDNVLVDAEGRPTVLDFGISLWSAPGARLTQAGRVLGTPLYLAPEQLVDAPVDGRADLYAAGVMLYQALSGRVPHEAEEVRVLLRARLSWPAVPIQDVVPDIPAQLAEVVDRLLAQRPEDRFRSAAEVLIALRGGRVPRRHGPELPRLGDRAPLRALVEAARARRPVDVVGPRGSGRSRCLRDAGEALEHAGLRVVWLEPSRAPLGSLLPLLGSLEEQSARRLEDVTAWAAAQLRRALDEGAVILADDADRLDPWSAAILERCRAGEGALVRAVAGVPRALPGSPRADVIPLGPLDEAALSPLFAGPDRLFHLREDAARALWERTDGIPARVEAELTLWLQLGLARWDGATLVVERESLDRLSAGIRETTPAVEGRALEEEPHLGELLRWLGFAGHQLDIEQLAAAMGRPVWRVEAECEQLVRRGIARRRSGDRVEPIGQVDITWPAARRIKAHRAIAGVLRPGQEGRLFHLLAGNEELEAAREAIEVALGRASAGMLGHAVAAVGEALLVARRQGGEAAAEAELGILSVWVKIAFAEGTPRAMDRVLYELSRAVARGPEVTRLELLVQAALAGLGPRGERARELADDISPFSDPALERRRHGVRIVAAARRASPLLLAQALVEVDAWAERSGHPMARLCLVEGRARLRYIEGRFDEAAALHAEAAASEPWQTGRIAAMLSSASALLEAFRHREAAARAEAARELAARCRNPYWEGRAEWLARSALYRMGEAAEPDLELVEAIGRVGVPQLEALVCLTEAAVAYRAERAAVAAELGGRAARLWRGMDRPSGALLSRCLALAAGAMADEGEVEELAAAAMACRVPGIGLQALGLLGRVAPGARAGFRGALGALAEGIPRERWDERMDVLSAAEAFEGAGGEGAG